jgi:hypothetical protein
VKKEMKRKEIVHKGTIPINQASSRVSLQKERVAAATTLGLDYM